MIYFIQDSDTLGIKIGFVESDHHDAVEARMRVLQTGNPSRLYLLATYPGSRTFEATLHRQFSEHRLMGEWFRPVPGLLLLIARARELVALGEGDCWQCGASRRGVVSRHSIIRPCHFAAPMGA